MQWVKYYVLSFLIVLVIELTPPFLMMVFIDSLGLFLGSFIHLWKYVMAVVIVVLQVAILYLNKTRDGVRLKFFIAFACIYSLVYLFTYTLWTNMLCESRYMMDPVSTGDPDLFDPYYKPFIGKHTLFIIPLILQVLIFILLYRKNKQAVSQTIS